MFARELPFRFGIMWLNLFSYYLKLNTYKNGLIFFFQRDFETAAKLYKRATEIKEQDSGYQGKDLISRRSSSGDTNSTVKNLLN